MTEVVDISSLLASLVHYPRIHLFLLFSACAAIPAVAVAWFWTRERLRERPGPGPR